MGIKIDKELEERIISVAREVLKKIDVDIPQLKLLDDYDLADGLRIDFKENKITINKNKLEKYLRENEKYEGPIDSDKVNEILREKLDQLNILKLKTL